MVYYIQNIATIIHADASIVNDASIEYLLIDSRKIVFPQTSVFFAISGPRRDGHQFIKEVYERGVRSFVVKKEFDAKAFPQANFLKVNDVLTALQDYIKSRDVTTVNPPNADTILYGIKSYIKSEFDESCG